MRNLPDALADTVAQIQPRLNWRILPDDALNSRWRVRVWFEDAFLEVEILDLEGDAVGCVLERRNLSRRAMQRFMDILMDELDESPMHPPGGSPVA